MTPERFEGDATDFRERVIWVIRNFAGKPTRYKVLEDRFGISARKWQNVCNHVQQPSIEMVAALASVYPFFLAWMVTGKGRTLMQLDPSDTGWFNRLVNALEDSPAAQADVLHRYADRLSSDHGIAVTEADTSATDVPKREALEQSLGNAEQKKRTTKTKSDGNQTK